MSTGSMFLPFAQPALRAALLGAVLLGAAGATPAVPAAAQPEFPGCGFACQAGIDEGPTFSDIDGDGLAVTDEGTHGTDPFVYDTDGDGVGDGDEVYVYGTNPAVFDCSLGCRVGPEEGSTSLFSDIDGDGLSNDDETYLYGTDPYQADTDGDGWWDSTELFGGDPNNSNCDTSNPLDPASTPLCLH